MLVEASPGLKEWRSTVTLAAKKEMMNGVLFQPFQDAVRVAMVFYLPKPKSVKRVYPTVPPDVDKLVRAVLDAITDAHVWKDDSQVVEVVAHKRYAISEEQMGVTVSIHAL